MRKMKYIVLIGAAVLCCSSCSKQDSEQMIELDEVDITQETTSSEVTDQDATENRAAENGTNENGVTEAVNAEQADKGVPETVADICVHVCGAVENPGVYVISDAARVYEVIEDAGGLTEDAAADYLNQAAALADGQQIYVPTVAEVDDGTTFPKAADILTTESAGDGQENDGADAAVNINTASAEQLKSLTGIGDSRAQSIIAYRESHDGFKSIEEIMQVEGIKEGMYSKIKDRIRIE